jgi:hypothetical protein
VTRARKSDAAVAPGGFTVIPVFRRRANS